MSEKKFFDVRLYNRFGLMANLVFIIIWYFANDGLAFWDDFTYLNFANQINEGTFEITNNHFTSRVAFLYPVAWIIKYVGINQFTITIFPLFCGLLVLNLLLWLGHLYHHWLGLLTATFFICDYRVITFITHLFPEMSITLFIFGALVAYDRVNRGEGDHRLLALMTSGGLFLAYLTKMTVIMVGPLFLFLFINDYWRRSSNKSYWLITVILLLFFVLCNGFWYQEVYGDFYYRFGNISDNHEATTKTFFDKDCLTILKRLTYLPLLVFFKGSFFIPFFFALPALLKIRKSDWHIINPEKLWPIAVLVILATWWLMNATWRNISPRPVDIRHLTFLIPIMLMAGGMYWVKTPLLTAIRYSKVKFGIAFLLIIPLFKIIHSEDRNFNELDELIRNELSPNEQPIRVFTDGLTSYGYPYFYDFKATKDQYIWFSEMKGEIPEKGDYLLINQPYLNERYEDNKNLKIFKELIDKQGLKLDPLFGEKIDVYRIVQ